MSFLGEFIKYLMSFYAIFMKFYVTEKNHTLPEKEGDIKVEVGNTGHIHTV